MKNDSLKYSPWVKALCFALSVIMSALFAFNALHALIPFAYFPFADLSESERKGFYASETAKETFYSQVCNLGGISRKTPAEYEKELKSQKEKQVEAALEKYINAKIEIIRSELLYVVNNYSDGYDESYAQGLTEEYINSIPDTPSKEQKYPVDPYAPAGVRVAQKVLNYADGREFLKYENLIREDAFDGRYYIETDFFNNISDGSMEFTMNEKEAQDTLNKCADEAIINQVENYKSNYYSTESEIENLVNIKYYLKTGDKVLTNMEDKNAEIKSASEHDFFCIKSDEKVKFDGLPEWISHDSQSVIKYNFADCDEAIIYMVNEDELSGTDAITESYNAFNEFNYDVKPYISRAVLFLILSIAALVVMLNLSGHKRGCDGITLSFIDKVPGDIHFIVSAGLITAGAVGTIALLNEISHEDNIGFLQEAVKPATLIFAVLWMILIELIASIVRTAKSDKSYFGGFLIVRIIKFIFKILKKVFLIIMDKVENSVLKYKPKYFRWFVVIAAFILCLIPPVGAVILAFFLAKYVRNLDRVVEGSKKRESVDFGKEKVHESLEILNDSIKISNEEVAAAVEKAVKNERTKTELITNVSHDLKTPLTSIISYVNLLKSREIGDEDAQKYIDIIDEKSANLKVLIENLIEASKVSAGNIKLNKTKINLKELVIQGLVEYAPEFESRNLEVRFNEACDAVTVFADGQQTYRIIENLISNAKKYSAPDTRVYASLREENGFGVFEIKNTSKAPLDISPEELTERFVRGDASRGEEEGNGLGLSIAKELCALQGGKLEIIIDGDLFKATVYLPL